MAEILSGAIRDDPLEFEPIPDWTEEDFLNSSRPHEWILEHGGGDDYKTLRYRDMTAKLAKKYKINNFSSQFNEYRKMKRKDGLGKPESNTTNFDGQPLELEIGDYIANDADGIIGHDQFGNSITVCEHPIMPVKRLTNIDTGEVQLEIAFKRGNFWKYQVVPRTMLATASRIVELSAWGLGIDSENAKQMVKYFTRVENLNYDTIPESVSTKRLGWVGENLFAPYVDKLEYDGDPCERHIFDAVSQKGSYSRWIDCMTEARQKNKALQIVLAASFASVLIKPCNSNNFIVHLWGGTEAGKTVALMAAISVWGNPDKSAGLFRTFNSTDVGIEMAAATSNSIPLFIDELQIAKDRKSFDELIYKLAEGTGRTRGAKTGGLRASTSWANTTITTGEMPITGANSGAGAINRTVEIDCKGIKLFESPRDAVDVVLANYGFAGQHFIGLLQQNMELAKNLVSDYIKQFSKTDILDKQAISASLILAADKLASMWVFGDADSALTIDDISPFLTTKQEADVNARALEWLYGWVGEHINNFVTDEKTPENSVIYGKISDDYIYIIRKSFNEAISDAGFNPTAFLDWASSKSLLKRSGNHMDITTRVGKSKVQRCVAIKDNFSDYDSDNIVQDAEDELPL